MIGVAEKLGLKAPMTFDILKFVFDYVSVFVKPYILTDKLILNIYSNNKIDQNR